MNIRDLAKEAGVSVATISRVINHPETVLPETRERVCEYIKKYGYDPRPAMKGVRGRKVVTLIVPSLIHCEEVIRGVQSVIAPKGMLLSIMEYSGAADTAQCLHTAAAAKSTGILLMGQASLDPVELQQETPLVFIGKYNQPQNQNICYINYHEGAEKMTAHLYDMGCRRIWLLQTVEDYPEKEQITEGYRKAAATRGLPTKECRVLEAEDSVKGGYTAGRELLIGEELPDAVFAATDALALGLMRAAREAQITVPGQLAIAGFTNNAAGAVVTPELTTMEHPTFRLGAVAARRLVELIEDSTLYEVETHEIILKSRLRVRKSCGNKKDIYELFE